MPTKLRDLVVHCWDSEPENRPSCQGVLQQLAILQAEFEDPKKFTPEIETK